MSSTIISLRHFILWASTKVDGDPNKIVVLAKKRFFDDLIDSISRAEEVRYVNTGGSCSDNAISFHGSTIVCCEENGMARIGFLPDGMSFFDFG